jgi:16S rRNA processing protein RimM
VATGATAVVGRVRRAHGLKGELVVLPITDAPDAIFAPGARVFAGTPDGELASDPHTGMPRALTVKATRPFKDGLLVFFDGIADRTEAERWNGRTFLVPAGELAPPEEGALFLHELPGMRAVDAAGAPLGEVRGWYELPQGIMLELLTSRGLRDVPFNEAFVRHLDRNARTMTLDVPEGLLE